MPILSREKKPKGGAQPS